MHIWNKLSVGAFGSRLCANSFKVALIQSSPLGPEGKVCSLPFLILTSSTVKCNVAPPGMDPKNAYYS